MNFIFNEDPDLVSKNLVLCSLQFLLYLSTKYLHLLFSLLYYCGEGGVEKRNALGGERVRRRAGNQWASE